MPGVSTGGGADAFDARINGGLQSGDEASVDGVSMQQGFMSQGGMVSIFQDFPMSPDMVSEVEDPDVELRARLRSTLAAKSGHDEIRWRAIPRSCLRVPPERQLRANQWGWRSQGVKSNNFGANIGGPVKLPGLVRLVKTYFYLNFERYRQKGGSNRPTLNYPVARRGTATSPTGATRAAIRSRSTIRLRSTALTGHKQQFMGCDGTGSLWTQSCRQRRFFSSSSGGFTGSR